MNYWYIYCFKINGDNKYDIYLYIMYNKYVSFFSLMSKYSVIKY